nr:hypothetical protein [Salmonella enterica]WDM56817.1 hypothetical protein K0020_01020 [Salmonella enterica subsp. enterica serovar Heidelberg]
MAVSILLRGGRLLLGSGMAEAVMPMMMLNNTVAQTRLSIQRIYQVLAMPELSLPLSDQQPKEASITFEQVSFHIRKRVLAPRCRR